MTRRPRAWMLIGAMMVALATAWTVARQTEPQKALPATQAATTAAIQPATVPVADPATLPATQRVIAPPVDTAELSTRLTSAAAEVRTISTDVAQSVAPPRYEGEIDALPQQIDQRVDESQRSLAGQAAPEDLRDADESLSRLQTQVETLSRDLTDRARWLDQALRRLNDLTVRVQQQRTVAEAADISPEFATRADALLKLIDETTARAATARAEVNARQSKVDEQSQRLTQVIADVRAARETAVSRLFQRDRPPIWDQFGRANAQRVSAGTQESFRNQLADLRDYARGHVFNFVGQAAVFLAAVSVLRALRRRVDEWMTQEPDTRPAMSIFCHPLPAALLVSIFFSPWVYPQAPRLMWAILGALMLIPALRLLRLVMDRVMYPVLNALVLFYFVDNLQRVTATQPLLTQSLFLIEMLAGALFLWWFERSGRLTHVAGGVRGLPAPGQGMETTTKVAPASPEPQAAGNAVAPVKVAPVAESKPIGWIVRVATRTAGIIFAVAFVAGVIGFGGLANLIGQATLSSAYLACILYAGLRVMQGLALVVLRLRPLTLLRAVQRQRRLIYARVRLALQWLVMALWVLTVLELFSVRSLVTGWISEALTSPVTLGSLRFSLGGVLAFVAAIWGSFYLSRFIRWILESDVYPHLHLNRGLPYAISTTLHYAVLLLGFFLALAITGADLTKFTLLASAFGVGLGFGLQTIFNNFISGLILLFERPIKLGDVIQLDDAGAVVGTVSRIGIRASIIRTAAGADIIVPNGVLIAGRFTNWTLGDRRRAVAIAVTVAPDTDPQQVIGLLEAAAAQHPGIDQTPPPKAMLTGFTATALTFELNAWAEGYEEWGRVRGELNIKIIHALREAGVEMK